MKKVYFIDLFCGAGGVTSGIHLARYMRRKFAKVIACINHDPLAIDSHSLNHPDCLHYVEKIQVQDLTELRALVERLRREDPHCLIFIWASIECIEFSKAKGGLPKNADSRTLAEHLYRYLEVLQPDGLWIENVEEFMSWGPLDESGKPLSRRNGEDYIRWVNRVQEYGYNFDYRILNAADYGAYTSRKRYFAQFMRPGIPIAWPEATHAKTPRKGGLFGSLSPWQPVKDVLDLEDEGESIFTRKTALVEKSLERIYSGLTKFVSAGSSTFLTKYYGAAGQVAGISSPSPTLSTKDRLAVIKCKSFLMGTNYDNKPTSLDVPAPTVTASRKWTYLVNPSWGGCPTSTDQPSPVIVARQDKAPLYLVQAETGQVTIQVYETDSPCMVKIKEFMNAHGITDIKMRMLKIPELLRIQGFADGYVLKGTQADQKNLLVTQWR